MRRSRPHRGRGRGGWARVYIHAATILAVNPSLWTCHVRTEFGGRDFPDVPLGSPYLHPADGEGFLIMPEPGAAVWIAMPSEGDTRPFIVAFRSYFSKDPGSKSSPLTLNARMNRPRFNPGDMGIIGRNRNGIKVRRGGITELIGSPLSRRIYSARGHIIHDICQNYKMDAFGGSIRWLVARAETDPEGKQGTLFDFRGKEYANHKGHVVRAQIGGQLAETTEGDADGGSGQSGSAPASSELVKAPVLRLRFYEDGDKKEDELVPSGAVLVDKDGNLEIALKGTARIEVRGAAKATIDVSPSGKISLDADVAVEVKAPTITATATVKATTTAPVIEATAATSATIAAPSVSLVAGSAALTVSESGGVGVGEGAVGALADNGFSTMLAASLTEITFLVEALETVLGVVKIPATEALLQALSSSTFTSSKLKTDM